jgi:hypothetical protein
MEYTKKMLLVDPRVLDSLESKGSSPVPDVLSQSLKMLDDDMRGVLERRDVDFENKAKMYNQTLWRYLRRLDQYRDRPLGTVNVRPTDEIIPSRSSGDAADVTSPNENELSTVEKRVLESVPKAMQNKAKRLLNIMKMNSELRWNDRGEILYQDEVVKKSNLVDLVNDVLRKRKKVGTPTGWKPFATALGRMNVDRELVGHPDRWNFIQNHPTAPDAGITEDILMGDSNVADKTPALKPMRKEERNVASSSLKQNFTSQENPDNATPFGIKNGGVKKSKKLFKRGRKLAWSNKKLMQEWDTL